MTFEVPVVKRVEYHPTFVAVLTGGNTYRVSAFRRDGSRPTRPSASGSASDVRARLHEKLDEWLDEQGVERVA